MCYLQIPLTVVACGMNSWHTVFIPLYVRRDYVENSNEGGGQLARQPLPGG